MSAIRDVLANFGMPGQQADAGTAASATTAGPHCAASCATKRGNRNLNRRGVAARQHPQSGVRNDAEQAGFVALVKAEQKGSAGVRARWRNYCDVLGSGTRDPRLHSVDFLRTFFDLSATGQVPEPLHDQSLPGPEVSLEEAHAVLTSKVQNGQKVPGFKAAWVVFCDTLPLGTEDPLSYDNKSLRHFLLHWAPASKVELPSKDPYAGPPQHASLLSECVRSMQSRKLGWKSQWDVFSDTRGGGVRDPARHSEGILWEFILGATPRCPTKMLPQEHRDIYHSWLGGRTEVAEFGIMKAPEIGTGSDCSADNGADTGSLCSFSAYAVGCDDGPTYGYASEGWCAEALWSV